jgi:hypothetical protein
MQGIPLEDSKDYLPLLPNSLEGSPEGLVNNEVAYEIGSSTCLEESILPLNPLLTFIQDPHFLRMNSSGELVVDKNIELPTGPNTESRVDDPLYQSESFRTPIRNIGVFQKASSRHDIFDNLAFLASQMPMTSTAYTIPLDHFTDTTNNVVTVPDQLLIGSHSILPLRSPTLPWSHKLRMFLLEMWLSLKLLLEHHFCLDQICHVVKNQISI